VSRSNLDTSLAASETLLTFRPGETIFKDGDEPRGVYILQSGHADLLFSARNGRVKPLRRVDAGQILGLSAVVTGRPHDCTAIAAAVCRIGFVEHDAFLRALDECPSVWFSVLRLLSNDVNAVYDDMRLLARAR